MTIFFIACLILAETALIVLTFAKDREKAKWMKNRAAFRTAEFILLLGIVLLPVTHMKWRYSGALILLGALTLIAFLTWTVKCAKATGTAGKARVIASAVLSVLLILPALVPAFVFTNYNGLKTGGPYGIRESSAILVDADMADPFESDESRREVPVHFYYPDAEGSFPLIVFSHGAFGYYQSNYSTYAELASNGYVVAALDHPHHAFFSKDTDGRIVIVDSGFLSDAIAVSNGEKNMEEEYALFREWMDLRSADMNFVLDTFEAAKAENALDSAWRTDDESGILRVLSLTDTDRIGVMGHSMGGATAVSAGRTRDDIDAVIVLDGTMLGEIVSFENGAAAYNEDPYPVPLLDFGKKSDYSETAQAQNEYQFAYVNQYVIGRARDGKRVLFTDAGHMDFTDLPLFSPFLASMLGSESIDHEAFTLRLNGLVLRWFDYYLKGKGSPDLQAEY